MYQIVGNNKGINNFLRLAFCIFSFFYIILMPEISSTCKVLALINSVIVVNEMTTASPYSYSVHKITNLFIWIFFILANLLQYSSGSVVSSLPVQFTESDYERFQLINLLIIIVFNFTYHISIKGCRCESTTIHSYAVKSKTMFFLISIIGVALTLFYYRSNPILLFVRGTDGISFDSLSSNQTNGLLFRKTIRILPTICLIIALISKVFSRRELAILFCFMLITVFPTSLPRNSVAMYWIPICMLTIKKLHCNGALILVLFFSFFLIFPLLDIFRYFDASNTIDIDFNLDYLNTMNFDASQEFMTVMKWDVVTYGKQLLGVLLFFIPRSVWPNKAVGSGYLLADSHGVFGNISMPFWGEGYINLGYPGIVVFSIILAILLSKVDFRYWLKKENNDISTFGYADGIYMLMLGAITFILRGDLLSSYSSTFGVIVVYFLIMKICLRKVQ